MSITGEMVNWALCALVLAGLIVAWIALGFIGVCLPGMVNRFVTWLKWRRTWRRHSVYDPEYWEERVRR